MAADKGYAPSLFNVAIYYRNGLGVVTPDLDKAFEILETAKIAEKKEENVPVNNNKLAAGILSDQLPPSVGEPESVYLLGRVHHFGLGGAAVDLELALACYEVAAAAGHGEAAVARDLLRKEVLPQHANKTVLTTDTEDYDDGDSHYSSISSSPTLSQSKSFPTLTEIAKAGNRKRSGSIARLDSLDSGLY